MRKDSIQWLVPIVLAVAVGGALWFYWAKTHDDKPRIEQESPPAVTPEPEVPAEPVYPLPDAGPPAADEPELKPLPPLNQSDEYFELSLTDLFGDALDKQLVDTRLIERIVATIDNLPRDRLAESARPLAAVDGKFIVEAETNDEGITEKYFLSPDNYQRYDALVGMVENVNMDEVTELYQRFYPLLQKAYVDLGYPDGYFNDRMVRVIDELLATPEVEEPIPLVRPNVMYEFADPQLETLSSGQKVLLRMGSENAATVKEKLREFRQRITDQ